MLASTRDCQSFIRKYTLPLWHYGRKVFKFPSFGSLHTLDKTFDSEQLVVNTVSQKSSLLDLFSSYRRTNREEPSLHKDFRSSVPPGCPQQEGEGREGVVRWGSENTRLCRMDSVSHSVSYQRLQKSPTTTSLSDTAPHQIMSSLCGKMIFVVIATVFCCFPLLYCHVFKSTVVVCRFSWVFLNGDVRFLYAVLDLPSSSRIASMSSSFSFDSSFLISSRMSCFNLS